MRNLQFSMMLFVFGLVIWSPVFVGCGESAAQKNHDTLVGVYTATNTVKAAFVAWDKAHQAAIVEKAKGTSLDAGLKALADYKAKRDPVLSAFETVYSLITAALIVGDQPSLAKLQAAYADLVNAVTAFEKVIGES